MHANMLYKRKKYSTLLLPLFHFVEFVHLNGKNMLQSTKGFRHFYKPAFRIHLFIFPYYFRNSRGCLMSERLIQVLVYDAYLRYIKYIYLHADVDVWDNRWVLNTKFPQQSSIVETTQRHRDRLYICFPRDKQIIIIIIIIRSRDMCVYQSRIEVSMGSRALI